MRHFVRDAYDPAFDCRDWSRLAASWCRPPDDGVCRTLVATRRVGKTWALKGLGSAIGKNARYVDLRESGIPTGDAGTWLLDEPGWNLAQGPVQQLAAWVRSRSGLGESVVLALTPAEHEAFDRAFDGYRGPVRRDLPVLDEAEQRKLTGDSVALSLLPDDWRRNAFLLTLLLEHLGGRDPADADALADSARKATSVALTLHGYLPKVLDESLPAPWQAGLRAIARGRNPGDVAKSLEGVGLVRKFGGTWQISDPVLAAEVGRVLRIHHLSDLHFGPKTAEAVDAKDPMPMGRALAAVAGQGPIRDKYLARICNGNPPNLVLVSGDLAEHGTDGQLAEATSWLREVEASLKPHDALQRGPNVALVGGNHDVRWDLAKEGSKRHEAFHAAVAAWPHPALHEAPATRRLARATWTEADLDVVLLGSSELGGEEDKWMKPAIPAVLRALRKTGVTLSKPDRKVLEARLSRADPGLVHHGELDQLRGLPKEQALRIVVLHHPVATMPVPVEIAPFAGLINAGQVLSACFAAKADVVLHGHVHQAWFSTQGWPQSSGHAQVHVASAGTLGSRETFSQHGYNEIDVLYEGQRVLWWLRPVVYEGGAWKEQPEHGPFEARAG